jgi:hypothetical protein
MRPCFSFLAQQRVASIADVAQLVPRQRRQIPEDPIDVPLVATPGPVLFWKGRETTFDCRQALPRRQVEFRLRTSERPGNRGVPLVRYPSMLVLILADNAFCYSDRAGDLLL